MTPMKSTPEIGKVIYQIVIKFNILSFLRYGRKKKKVYRALMEIPEK
jgi:hypothetical protein